MSAAVSVISVPGLPEVCPGDDLPAMILAAIAGAGLHLADGDVLVVTQKIVSKAEGRIVDLATIQPSDFARRLAERWEKDPRQVEVVLRESARIVRMDRGVVICETRHGFICANAGVDASNVGRTGAVTLLPLDPDRSAAAIRDRIVAATGRQAAVIISDTFGRPWREGLTNVAIGVAGMDPFLDYAGQRDASGYELRVTKIALADELASAAELVMGKLDRTPVALVRGLGIEPAAGSARQLVRDPERDLFR